MEKLSLSKIQQIQEELKKANRLLDEYFRKEALKNREEKLKKFSNAEKRAYWAGIWMKGMRSVRQKVFNVSQGIQETFRFLSGFLKISLLA